MGTIRNGGNGAFSGKAGSFIGSTWNSVSYIKGIPKISNKPASQAQMEQRKKFATVLEFLAPIKDTLNIGLKGKAGTKATGFNMGIQLALANAITGTYPDYGIDLTKVVVSKGTLQEPSDFTVVASAPATLTLSWFLLPSGPSCFAEDKLLVLVYNNVRKLFLLYAAAAVRNDATVDIQIPANFAGEEIGVFAFFKQASNARCSKSLYVGPTIAI